MQTSSNDRERINLSFTDAANAQHLCWIYKRGATLGGYTITTCDTNSIASTNESVITICPDTFSTPKLGSCGKIMFPWVNRIIDGQYSFGGKNYQLDISEPARNNAIHGFAANYDWQVSKQTPSSVTLEFSTIDDSGNPLVEGYPFAVKATVCYQLIAEPISNQVKLQITLSVQTLDLKVTPPISIGIHPYISTQGCNLDECSLKASAPYHVKLTDRLVPADNYIEPIKPDNDTLTKDNYDFCSGKLLKNYQLDNAWVYYLADDNPGQNESVNTDSNFNQCKQKVNCVSFSRPNGRTTIVNSTANFPALVMYTPPPRTALAIEPLTSLANAFRTNDFLLDLDKDGKWTGTVEIFDFAQ